MGPVSKKEGWRLVNSNMQTKVWRMKSNRKWPWVGEDRRDEDHHMKEEGGRKRDIKDRREYQWRRRNQNADEDWGGDVRLFSHSRKQKAEKIKWKTSFVFSNKNYVNDGCISGSMISWQGRSEVVWYFGKMKRHNRKDVDFCQGDDGEDDNRDEHIRYTYQKDDCDVVAIFLG